jgi:hypothetical protein
VQSGLASPIVPGLGSEERFDLGLAGILECVKPHARMAIRFQCLLGVTKYPVHDLVVIIVRKCGEIFAEHGDVIIAIIMISHLAHDVAERDVLSVAIGFGEETALQSHFDAGVALIIIIPPLCGPPEEGECVLR